MNHTGLRTWIEVDTRALRHNYGVFRKLLNAKTKLMAVVKSNAYGHWLVEFSRMLERCGADWFGVDSIVEARTLRKEAIGKSLLILGHTVPECYQEAARINASVTISNFDALKNATRKISAKKSLKVHIKTDTGMTRQGFLIKDMPRVLKILKQNQKKIIFEGLYTHFAAAKNPAFPSDTNAQIRQFDSVIKLTRKSGFNPLVHASATSGTIVFPKAHYGMVRVGIGMYGYWPSPEVQAAFEDTIVLKPALMWKTAIGEIKNVPKGSRVGYDFTETLQKPSRVAILPVGYWHGYPRALSSIGHVAIRGKRAKVLGRISMDMIIIDISHIKSVRTGDEVLLLGGAIPAEEVANLAGTINYEIITRLNPLIKRIYI